MKKKDRAPKLYDARLAFLGAQAFHEQALPFLNRIGNDMERSHHIAVHDQGGLIASATSLALAIELYLKALRILLGMPVPETHELSRLYRDLPPHIRAQIEELYASAPSVPTSAAVALEIAISVKLSQAALDKVDKATPKEAPDASLPALLRRSRHAFQTWRYLHEGAKPGEVFFLRYEYHYMHVAAQTLHRAVEQGLQQRQVLRARHKPPAA